MRTSRALRTSATALTTVVALGLTAACGDDADSGSPSASRTASNGDVFNDADVAFATDMIPHHAQAIQMVTLTDTRTLDPAVAQLAANIRAAQSPEVETMVDWLTAWGEEVPETSLDHSHGDHDLDEMPDMSGEDMPGMMSPDEMQELSQAPDTEFRDQWLRMMKEHHEGAVEMARTEIAEGAFPDAVALARSIITTQEREIDEIDQLLAG
jgi:uncharacterized protein (DUF305 family)